MIVSIITVMLQILSVATIIILIARDSAFFLKPLNLENLKLL